MPICIAGMHRSGTSLTTRLLNLSGLFLGNESEMLPPSPSNQEGYWENTRFVNLNDEILAELGGGWDLAPPLREDWDLSPKFLPHRLRAIQILKDFEGREPWGWKDPRNTITLPFWLRLIPDLKVVICVRNPLEVADSLTRRNGFSTQAGITLWAGYYSRVLAAVRPEQRLVTHYQSQFVDNRAEMQRILHFAGLPVSQSILDELSAVPKEGLRHNRLEMRELVEGRLPCDVVRTYLGLCAEAGPVYRQAFAAEMQHASEHTDEQQFEAANQRRYWYIVHLTSQLTTELAEKDKQQALANRLGHEEAEKLRLRIEQLEHRLQWKRYRVAEWLAVKLHSLRQFHPLKLFSPARRDASSQSIAGDQWTDAVLAAKPAGALPRPSEIAPSVTRSPAPQSSPAPRSAVAQSSSSPSSGVGLSSG